MSANFWLAIAVLVGFGLTAGNIVAAYVGARKQLEVEDARIATGQRLYRDEISEQRDPNATAENGLARVAKYEALYAEHGIVRATYDNQIHLAAFESRRIIGFLLDSSRGNLIWAGIGLFVSTAASVWSMLLA